MKKFLLILVLAIMCSSVVRADDIGDGLDLYLTGEKAKGVNLLLPLAIKGDVRAQKMLGTIYDLEKEYTKAEKWHRKAAEQGDGNSQLSLGRMYKYGDAVPQDYLLSHMWYNLGHGNANEEWTKQLAEEGRDFIAKKMTPAQIAEAQKLARECVKKSYKNCD